MLDARLGRWFSPDPITHPWQSPYASMDNNPIALVDPLGLSTGPGKGDFTSSFGGGDNTFECPTWSGNNAGTNFGFDPTQFAGQDGNKIPVVNPSGKWVYTNELYYNAAKNTGGAQINTSKNAQGEYIEQVVVDNMKFSMVQKSWGERYFYEWKVDVVMKSSATQPGVNTSPDNVAPTGAPTDDSSSDFKKERQTGSNSSMGKPKINTPKKHPRPLSPPKTPVIPPAIPNQVIVPRVPAPLAPPSSDPGVIARDMCWVCWIGESPVHWNTSVRNIIDWLLANPNYDLDLTSTAGAWLDDSWSPEELRLIQKRYNELINDITEQAGGSINGASRVHLKYAPGAKGNNLKLTPKLR